MNLLQRVKNIIAIGRAVRPLADGRIQIQFFSNDTRELPHPQPYGFASSPETGEAVGVFPGGDRSRGVVLVLSSAGSPSLAKGEVAVWDSHGGSVIKLMQDGTVAVIPGGGG
ncbi:MAG: hypothetical protein B6D68_02505, partial [spirochete symbiont of Stewartia floridana]